jgi:translation elongation factor P/translation initiation factor 5A
MDLKVGSIVKYHGYIFLVLKTETNHQADMPHLYRADCFCFTTGNLIEKMHLWDDMMEILV